MMSNRMAPPPPTPTTTVGLARLLLCLLLISITGFRAQPAPPPIALPGCLDRCGNVSIPYPFGIGPKCYLNPWYSVICNHTSDSPRAFLAGLSWNYTHYNFTRFAWIMEINTTRKALTSSTNRPLTLSIYGSRTLDVGNDQGKLTAWKSLDMKKKPFRLMPLLNTVVVVGCGGSAAIVSSQNQIVAGCTTVCPNDNSTSSTNPAANSSCYGIGCCQIEVPTSLDYFSLDFRSLPGSSSDNGSNFSFRFFSVISSSQVAHMGINYTSLEPQDFSTILEWKLPTLPNNVPNHSNAWCTPYDTLQQSFYCYCKDHYKGNPYLPQGCQVIQECEHCPDQCAGNNRTGYECYYPIYKKSAAPIALGLGISLGSISLCVVLYGLFLLIKIRKEIRQRKSNFKKNGGLLLQQQTTTREGAFERTKVFTCDELERATDNFNENRILGRGGQGTVYKGMLRDGTIVAIKKSKRVDERELGQFINEVVILSRINHRNVVKLFGCCLETEVPLLVYEFVLNGTLFQHLHNPREDFRITWKMRMQIAIESAEALRYLHSSSSTPIYHRDIKSSNILLDDRYRAKVSDFGISRTVSIDETHVTTCVQGTYGYIDPEYFQSNQFTEKSDVYSFGIVLLELLTSKKPVHTERSTNCRSLVSEFFLCRQQSRLCDIVDAGVLKEARKVELEGFADLVERCLSMNGIRRPTMNAVATTLQMINSQNDVPHPSPEQIVLAEDPFCLVNEGPFSISAPPSSSGDFYRYAQPLLFDSDSSM